MTHNFIQLQERLYDNEHLDIYHVNILAWVQSYNRQKKPFFMSNEELAKKLTCNPKTVKRKFDDLIKWDLIVNVGKRGRSWVRETDGDRIHKFLHYGPKVHNEDRLRTLSTDQTDTESSYNTTKTSNKTSLRAEAFSNASPSIDEIVSCLD